MIEIPKILLTLFRWGFATVKKKVQIIKTKDSKVNIKHFIKQQTIHTRNVDKDTRQESISSNGY